MTIINKCNTCYFYENTPVTSSLTRATCTLYNKLLPFQEIMFRTECIYWTEKETITPTSIPVEMTTYKPVSEPTFTYQFFTTNRITGCMKCPFYVTQYDEANHYVHNTCKGVCPTKSFAVPGMFYNHQTEDKLAEWFKECKLFAVQEIK